jgi:hypothetical protein
MCFRDAVTIPQSFPVCGGYYYLDDDALEVFRAGVFSDLKEQSPNLYDFFPFILKIKPVEGVLPSFKRGSQEGLFTRLL